MRESCDIVGTAQGDAVQTKFEEFKPTGGKITIRCELIERSGSNEVWYGGEEWISPNC
jgi:hypothetical protein